MKRHHHLRRFAPLLALVIFALAATAAFAHPLGNFTINHYARIEPSSNQIRVRYVLDFAEIPTFQEKQNMDSNGDGQVSEAEHNAFLNALVPGLVENLALTVNGKSAPLTLEPSSAQSEFLPGQGGLDVMRVTMWFDAPYQLAAAGDAIEFSDDNYRERLGWREIVVRDGNGVSIRNSNVAATDQSNELTAYPDSLLTNPLNVRQATFTSMPGVGSAVTASANSSNGITTGALGAFDRTRDAFGKLLTDNQDLSPAALAIAFLAAMALGALHSFSPGHGKAVVGSYLVGSRGNWQHAVFLGLVVTATHTAGVYALGFVTLFLSAYILPEQLFPWLGFISGMLVALIGIRLLFDRWRSARSQTTSYDKAIKSSAFAKNGRSRNPVLNRAPQPELVHAHADGIAHSPTYATMHATVAAPGTVHSHDFATPEEEEAHAREHLAEIQTLEKPSWKNLVSLGISGGLLPCPSALVVMLSAIALGRVMYGLFLIVGFSLGLAGVLVLTGLALLYAGRFAGKYLGGQKMGWFMRYIPIVSAMFVAVLGLGIALESLLQTSFIP